MTQAEHDEELERFLERRSSLHERLSRADDAQPPAELDQLVLTQAKEAISASTGHTLRSKRWVMPVALAASLVLVVSVVLNVDRERRAGDAAPVMSAARESTPLLAPQAADDAAASVLETTREPAVANRMSAPPAEPEAARRTSSAEGGSTPLLGGSSVRSYAPLAAPPAEGPAPDAPALAPAAPLAKQQVSDADQAPPSAALVQTPAWRSNPTAWTREIERLRADGRIEEADRELEAFRRAYPRQPGHAVAQPPLK